MQCPKMLIVVLALVSVAACDNKEAAPPAGSASPAAPGPSGAAKAPAALEWKKLDKLGLQVEMPADAEVMDTSADAPNASIFNNDCKVSVNTVTPVYTESYDSAVKEVKGDPGTKFKEFKKNEKTADGWHFEWVAEGSMEPKPVYAVLIRKTIGGKQYECSEKSETPEAAACTVRACQSLKKL